MIHRKIIRHLFVHNHDDFSQHHAHALSLLSLFLYLQIFIALTAGFYFVRVKAPQILGTVTFSADQVIALTNAKRAENGLGALTFNSQLAQAAAGKAQDMHVTNYWSHNSPTGKTPWSFISGAGYKYVYAGENLARDFDDANSTVNAWMASPSHRSNILDKNFKEIGVAVTSGTLTGKEGILVVQMFGTPVSQVPTQTNTAQVIASPSPTPVAGINIQPTPTPRVVAQATPSPSATPSPFLELAQVSPEPDVGPGVEDFSGQTILSTRQYSYSRIASLILIAFIFSLFSLEVLYVVRKDHLVLRSQVLAHLGFLGFLLLVIWYAVGGVIL